MPTESENKLQILVAALDWGLGHTTRCIPVVYELLEQGVNVVLAGNEIQIALLKKEFPQCKFLRLDGYEVSYSKKGKLFEWKILQQAPKILSTISAEHRWLKGIVENERIDGIISDNRFGLHHKTVPSVFITHQLLIKSGLGKRADKILQRFNYKYINRFNRCWVPDYTDTPNLAGELSHPERMPETSCKYIGPLSRMKLLPGERVQNHILVMLSGPEPQRTLFENLIFEQLRNFNGMATVVRGLPAGTENIPEISGVKIYNHLPKNELNREMNLAEYIVCRSGYSSVMDIHAVAASSIQIPTPGQTEQEYLAKYLASQNFCITACQHDFNLTQLLDKARSFVFQSSFDRKKYSLGEAVREFISDCKKRKSKRPLVS